MSRRSEPSPANLPRYSIPLAAFMVGVPVSTLRTWVGSSRTDSLIVPPDGGGHLSFTNLLEVHLLLATRKRRVPLQRTRLALKYLREQIDDPHPLLAQEFFQHGPDLFIKSLAGEQLSAPLNISRSGQLGIKVVLEDLLQRIERDARGRPVRLFPLRAHNKHVSIAPDVRLGQAVVHGTGILAATLRNRYDGGESTDQLADDYGLTVDQVEDAIAYAAAS